MKREMKGALGNKKLLQFKNIGQIDRAGLIKRQMAPRKGDSLTIQHIISFAGLHFHFNVIKGTLKP